MTPTEILALIEENEEDEAALREELKEAYAKIAVDNYIAALLVIQTAYDAEDITALKAEHDIKTLSL